MQPLPGWTRRVLAHRPALMLVENTIAAGTALPLHQHPHEQALYVLQGELVLVCGGETARLRAGDSLAIAGGVEHGVTALTDIVVLDVFAPEREDFLG